ncbi:MAG: beta-xylosidase [Acidobacteriaceae bacterium]|nr:beta-xylosidase [Acidobacteriaceae bacterium]
MRPCLLLLFALPSLAQDRVIIQVNAAQSAGTFKPISRYFGYDEPNYTYMQYGTKLTRELAESSRDPVYIRTHFMLATGDGQPGFKWGSTNAYTESSDGKPVYDWTISDRILDTYLQNKAKPFVEIGFMPKALSTNPEPYEPQWQPGAKFDKYYVGWSYPPKDYAKWGELVYQWVRHCVQKYGAEEVQSWYWEVWNEPDIGYWHGTPEEYDKLYDYSAKAVKRALPRARVGGPASTGPANPKAAAFLKQFLEHCDRSGVPLDFITYHAKGRPEVADGHVRMGISKNADDVLKGFQIVASFPKFSKLPIVLSESDPEGCAACSARVYPQNAYRNGPLYASYTAAMLNTILKLADREHTNIEGMLTWAFEFEGQPYFDGFRTLATNGIDKPVLNLFRMVGLMHGECVPVESSAAIKVDDILSTGIRNAPAIDALAVRADRRLTVLAWNYHDDDVPAPDANVAIQIGGIPAAANRILLRHYRIDATHSNAYTVWKALGAPQHPSTEQYAQLESAGRLELLQSPRWLSHSNPLVCDFALPRQGVSLLELTW